jgi:UDP-GlcNAc:undecaprenyl-phosphate/decaprenyl-phosphate GlcNAc-1-phosphate transferase
MSISGAEYLILAIAAFALSGFLTWPIRLLAIKLGAMDQPNMSRKTQLEPVPYLGGVSIALTISIITYGSIFYSDNTKTTFALVSYLLLPAFLLGLMGLIDDLRGLQPWPRLVVQSLVAVVVSLLMLKANTIGVELSNSFINQLVCILWIVGICNSINFFDNLDGGASGTVALSTFGIGFIAYSEGQELITALSVVTFGATLGFLIWNKSPAKIYMGDAGALFLGVVVSVLSIRLNPGIVPAWNSVALLPILLAVPLLDTSVAVLSRVRRGISPFTGGKDHLSHRLMRKGFSKRATAYCLWSMQASFVALAIVIYTWTAAVGVGPIALAAIYWLGAFVWFWRIASTD